MYPQHPLYPQTRQKGRHQVPPHTLRIGKAPDHSRWVSPSLEWAFLGIGTIWNPLPSPSRSFLVSWHPIITSTGVTSNRNVPIKTTYRRQYRSVPIAAKPQKVRMPDPNPAECVARGLFTQASLLVAPHISFSDYQHNPQQPPPPPPLPFWASPLPLFFPPPTPPPTPPTTPTPPSSSCL